MIGSLENCISVDDVRRCAWRQLTSHAEHRTGAGLRVVLKNRIVKSAMSDSLGDGTGHPTDSECKLYRRWAKGGLAASIIGKVQGSPFFSEKPGNLFTTCSCSELAAPQLPFRACPSISTRCLGFVSSP